MKKIIIALGFLGILGGSATAAFAGYFDTTPVTRCDTQITHTLQIGSENNDVSILQEMLSRAGYLYVNPNGYFGPSTKAAVKRFQSANGLSSTGIVGELTRNAVNERLCDSDVRGETLSYDYNGYSSGITYVDQYDPYAVVISPKVTTPVVYATPQENAISFSTTRNSSSNYAINSNAVSSYIPANYQMTPSNVLVPNTIIPNVITPVSSQIQSTNIIYSPSIGYTYGITQKSGSLTITSPVTNSIYNEGDTVNLVWSTSNLNATGFQVFLENTSTGQSKQVAATRNMSAPFVLTKELLDAVCAGTCSNDQQGSFKVVITTPVTDIAGITSNFRAAVSPITIKRPYSVSAVVSISANKTPVDSAERFKLYVNIPSFNSWDVNLREDANIKIHAVCINNVQVSIAGVPCGQEFSMPVSVLLAQQGIPTTATNTTWYKQGIAFEATVFNRIGQVMGTATTTVVVNSAPFSW